MFGKIKSLFFSNRTTAQTIAKNGFWLLSGELISRVVRAGIVIYAARVLGAADFGALSYALTIAGFATILADVGLSQILTREAARDQANRGAYFSTALFLKGVLILINVALILFIAPLFTKIATARLLLPLAVFLVIFDTLRDFGFALFRAMEKMEWEAIVKIAMNAIVAAAGFAFLFYRATAYSLALGYVVGTGIGCLITYIVLWPHLKGAFKHFQKTLLKPIMVAAWPIGLLALLGTIMINTDMIMLGWMRSPEELGFYAAAQKPILLLYILPTLIASAIFPIMARLAHGAKEEFQHILNRGISASLMLALPIAVGGFVLRDEIMQALYGSDYLPAAASFGVLLLTILVIYPTSILNNAILAHNRQRSFLTFFSIGAISNIIFNAILIPPYGIEGAAAATLGSQILSTLLIFRAMKKISPFHSFSQSGRFVVASIVMGALAYLLHHLGVNFFVNLGSAILLYFVILAAMKEPLLREASRLMRTGEH